MYHVYIYIYIYIYIHIHVGFRTFNVRELTVSLRWAEAVAAKDAGDRGFRGGPP